MKSKNGFTLVELLAVIAILAILILIALPNVIGMVNKAKRSTFETQVRKVAQVSQQKLFTAGNSEKTFDCNDLLSGNSFSDCTATVEGSSVSIDALGSGQYSNYLMVDVTNKANSGTLIDLNNLKEVEVEEEKNINETLVKNSKINETMFKILTDQEYIDLALKIDNSNPSETEIESAKKEYNSVISKISYDGNMIINNSDKELFYLFKINFTDKMLGRYKIVWHDISDLALNDEIIDNKDKNSEDFFESYDVDRNNNIIEGIINVTKSQNYYFGSVLKSRSKNLGFEIEKLKGEDALKLVGNKNITIKSSEVKNYKDAGIKNNSEKLQSGEYYSYTNLKSEVGTYKYNYVIKTNNGIKKLVRNIIVADYTDSRCFAFNNGVIEHYYYYIDNDSSKARCPSDVIIPNKINGQDVVEISWGAFTVGCSNNIVVPTNSNNKYTIKNMACLARGMGITSVTLPSNLKIIGNIAFINNNLSSLVIPKSVTEIGYGAFANNKLQTVKFEGNIKNITGGCDSFDGEEHSEEVNNIVENTTWCNRK